jgi:hypothetical protein
MVLGSALPDTVSSVKASGSLLSLQVVSQLITHIQKDLQGITLLDQKFNPTIIQYVLSKVQAAISVIENNSANSLTTITIQVLKGLMPLTEQDITIITNIMTFIVDNNLITEIEQETKPILSKIKTYVLGNKKK